MDVYETKVLHLLSVIELNLNFNESDICHLNNLKILSNNAGFNLSQKNGQNYSL